MYSPVASAGETIEEGYILWAVLACDANACAVAAAS